jgi:hypothetical protein
MQSSEVVEFGVMVVEGSAYTKVLVQRPLWPDDRTCRERDTSRTQRKFQPVDACRAKTIGETMVGVRFKVRRRLLKLLDWLTMVIFAPRIPDSYTSSHLT